MNKEQKKKVIDYIDNAKKRGYSEDYIKEKLKESGFAKEEIANLFKTRKGSNLIKISLISISVIIIILIAFLIYTNVKPCGRACFINKADTCEKAELTLLQNGTTMHYKTENCILTKKITALAAAEPQEVKDLFLNAELTCSYEKGQFNENWIDYYSKDLDNCEGELKDIVQEIMTYTPILS